MYRVLLVSVGLLVSLHPCWADLDKVLSAITTWAESCPGMESNTPACQLLKEQAGETVLVLGSNCNRVQKAQLERLLVGFEDDFVESLKQGKFHEDFKGMHMQQIAHLILCVRMHEKQWKEACREKVKPLPSCPIASMKGGHKELNFPIDFDSSCQKIFIDTGSPLGAGTYSLFTTAVEYQNSKPGKKWVPLAKGVSTNKGNWSKQELESKFIELKQTGVIGQDIPMIDEYLEWVRDYLIEEEARNKKRREKTLAVHRKLNGIPGLVTLEDANEERVYLPRFREDLFSATNTPEKRKALGVFTIAQALRLAIPGLEGMSKAGFVHRDFKGDNVLTDFEGGPFGLDAKVADFDYAFHVKDRIKKKRTPGESKRVNENRTKGTPGFYAPEQLSKMFSGKTDDEKEENAKKADIFAAAVTAAESFGIGIERIEKLRDCHIEWVSSKVRTCLSELELLRNAVSKADTPPGIGKFLTKNLDPSLAKRQNIAEFRAELDQIARQQLVKEFNEKLSLGGMLVNDLRVAQGLAVRLGYAFVPIEDEKGLLRLGLVKPGGNPSTDKPILILADPTRNRAAFDREVAEKLGPKK